MAFCCVLIQIMLGSLGESSLSLPWIQEVIVYTNEGCGDWRRTEAGARTNGETPELPGR